MAYNVYHKSHGELTFDLIEKFVKKMKHIGTLEIKKKGLLSKCETIEFHHVNFLEVMRHFLSLTLQFGQQASQIRTDLHTDKECYQK